MEAKVEQSKSDQKEEVEEENVPGDVLDIYGGHEELVVQVKKNSS